jgi:hypothetical protein
MPLGITPISGLPAGGTATGAELVPMDQGGVTVNLTSAQLAALARTGLSAIDSGAVNAYVLTTAEPLTATPVGLTIIFTPLHANTAGSTVNLDGAGGTGVVDSAGNALTGGEISGPTFITWTGSQWQLVNVLPLVNKRTPAEIAATVVPVNYAIPSHLATGEVYPQRYGAKFDGVTNDTNALQNAFNVALQTSGACQVVMPTGTAIVGAAGGGFALTWGTNSATGASNHPPGLRGQGISTVIKCVAGFTGTVIGSRGNAGQFMRDFIVDGSGVAAICIDTSWPATLGTTTNNVYENVWVQNFTQNGWLAINDNQAKWTSITARGAASLGLSGFRVQGSGGSFSLDNIQVADSFLSITCQNCDIRGGFFRGIRLNENQGGFSQTGVNYIYLSGCQIYANPTTLSHVTDALPASHFTTGMVFDSCYLLASNGTAQTTTIDCGTAGKIEFNGCAFIFGGSTGTWNLYSPNATAIISPSFVELDGCTMTDGTHSVIINTPTGFITERMDVGATPGVVLSDYPMRVIYRNVISFPSGLTANTFTPIIPLAQMTDFGASYLLSVYVNASGADNLACAALVSSVSHQSGVGPTGAIAQGTTTNIANNGTNLISLRYGVAGSSGGNPAGIDAAINIALANGSTISVNLIRISNPTVSY